MGSQNCNTIFFQYPDMPSSGGSTPALPANEVFVGNALNVATAVPMSGDATIVSSGALTVTGIQTIPVDATAPTNGQTLIYNSGTGKYVPGTAGMIPLTDGNIYVGDGTNTAVSVTMSGDATIDDVGHLIVTGIQQIPVSVITPTDKQVLAYDQFGTGSYVPTTILTASLTSAHILVGNVSNIATDVAMSGDVSITNAGATKVLAIQNVAVDSMAPTNGQVLLYNSGTSKYVPTTFNALPTGTVQDQTLCWDNTLNDWTTNNNVLIAEGTPLASGYLKVNGGPGPAGGHVVYLAEFIADSGGPGTGSIDGLHINIKSTFATGLTVTATNYAGTGNDALGISTNVTGGTVNRAIHVIAGDIYVDPFVGAGERLISTDATGKLQIYSGGAPLGNSLTSANIFVGNGSNIATGVSVTGDATITNAGAIKVVAIQNEAIDTTAPTNGQVLTYLTSTSKWTPQTPSGGLPSLTDSHIFVGNVSNVATDVAVTGDITMANTGATKVVAIQNEAIDTTAPTNGQVLTYLTATSKWTPQTPSGGLPSLTDSHVFVGNVSNVATDVAVTGDITMANTGATKVVAIQNKAVDTTAPTDAQLLVYNNSTTKYVPVSLSSDVTITNAGVATVTGLSGKLSNSLTSANIFVGNGSNIATGVSVTGAISITNSGVTSYSGVVPIAKGGTNNTSFTDQRIPYYSSAGTQFIDSANLTFNGTTLNVAGMQITSNSISAVASLDMTIGLNYTSPATGITTLRSASSSGTNQLAGSLIITTGASTGTGIGTITLKTAPAGSSGSGSNAATTTMTITSTGLIHSGFTTNGIVTTTGGTGTFSVISTLPVSQGGTNNTSFTNNQVIYYQSSGTQFVGNANLTFDGTSLVVATNLTLNNTDLLYKNNLGHKIGSDPSVVFTTPNTMTFIGLGASGTNHNAGDTILSTGQSTGTGIGQILLQTAPAGSSGAGANFATTAITITSTTTSIASLSSNGVVKTSGGTGALGVVASTTVNDVLRGDMSFGPVIMAWTDVTGTTQAMAVNTNYIADNVGLVTLTLPTTAAVGDMIRVSGYGAGGWKIALNASQIVHYNNSSTTVGTGGDVHSSTSQYASVALLCTKTNLEFVIISVAGTIALT